MNNSVIFMFLASGIILATGTGLFFLLGTTPVTMSNDVVLYLPMLSDSSNSTFTKDWSIYSKNATSTGLTYVPLTTKNNNNSYGYYTSAGVNKFSTTVNLTTRNISTCVWAKDPQDLNNGVFGSELGAPYQKISFNLYESGKMQLYLGDGSTYDSNLNIINPNRVGWHYYCFSINGTGTVTFYHDGVNLGNSTTTKNATTFLVTILNSGYRPQLNGVSQIIVFNRTINNSEVSTLYNATKTIFSADNITASEKFDAWVTSITEHALDLPFRNDTSNSTYTKDYGANGKNGEVVNATYNVSDESYSFNGTTQYINTSFNMSGLTKLTMSGWFKRSSSNQIVVMSQSLDTNSIQINYWSDGAVYFAVGTYIMYATFNSNDANWHNTVLVFDGTGATNSDRLKAYQDGVLKTLTFTGTVPSITTSNGLFVVGVRNILSTKVYSNGSIDNVQILPVALTPSQISFLYSLGRNQNYTYNAKQLPASDVKAGVLSYSWNTDGFYLINDSSKILDMPMKPVSSNTTFTKDYASGNNGNVIKMDYYDNSYSSTGNISKYIVLPNITIYNYSSISIWAKINGTNLGTYHPFLTITDGDSKGIQFYVQSNKFGIYTTVPVTPPSYNVDNNWHNYIVSSNSTNTTIYVDGVFYSYDKAIYGTNATLFWLGRYTSNGLNGSIGSVLIFNRTLTAAEAKSIYVRGRQ